MTNKHMINTCEFLDICVAACGGTLEDTEICPCYELHKQLDQLKSENEDLKKSILQACPNCGEEYLNYKGVELYYENNDLKQTLAEIKPILEFYANSKMGVDKGNGIFELEVSNDNIGKLIYRYDTNPAKEALQKINEVLE